MIKPKPSLKYVRFRNKLQVARIILKNPALLKFRSAPDPPPQKDVGEALVKKESKNELDFLDIPGTDRLEPVNMDIVSCANINHP